MNFAKMQLTFKCCLIFIVIFFICLSSQVYADPTHQTLIFPNMKITSSEKSDDELNNKYRLYQLIDNNLKTTWVFNKRKYYEKVHNKKEDIWLKFESLNTDKIKSVELINGYSKSDILYKDNNKIIKVLVETELDKYVIDLKESMLFQKIILPHPSKKVKITVLDFKKGCKYDDTCISEVRLYNQSNQNMLNTNQFFIHIDSGEYPYYTILDKKLNKISSPYTEGIREVGFSPKGDKIYFIYNELDAGSGTGFDIYYTTINRYHHFFDKPVYTIEWINNSKVKIKWSKYIEKYEEEISIIDIGK